MMIYSCTCYYYGNNYYDDGLYAVFICLIFCTAEFLCKFLLKNHCPCGIKTTQSRISFVQKMQNAMQVDSENIFFKSDVFFIILYNSLFFIVHKIKLFNFEFAFCRKLCVFLMKKFFLNRKCIVQKICMQNSISCLQTYIFSNKKIG